MYIKSFEVGLVENFIWFLYSAEIENMIIIKHPVCSLYILCTAWI